MKEKTIYALGFFDGVHFGHQVLLKACRELAEEAGSPRTANVVLLGALASGMPFERSVWEDQIAAKVSYNELDLVFYFRSTDPEQEPYEAEKNLLRLCDVYNIPVATNIATAEALVTALGNGDLNWREFINPTSEYNRKKRIR